MKLRIASAKKSIYVGPSSITKIMFDLAFELKKEKPTFVTMGPKSEPIKDLKLAYEDLSYAFNEVMKALDFTKKDNGMKIRSVVKEAAVCGEACINDIPVTCCIARECAKFKIGTIEIVFDVIFSKAQIWSEATPKVLWEPGTGSIAELAMHAKEIETALGILQNPLGVITEAFHIIPQDYM